MGTVTNEFVVVVKKDLAGFLRLVKELKGSVTYSDTTSNFARLKFRGGPCNSEFINNVVRFLKESKDLIASCRCLSTYVDSLRVLGDASRGLAVVKSCATGCVTIGNKVLCERRTESINLLLETLVTPYSLKIRAFPVISGGYSLASSGLRQVISCDDSLIRKLLSIMCELEKCLSGV